MTWTFMAVPRTACERGWRGKGERGWRGEGERGWRGKGERGGVTGVMI